MASTTVSRVPEHTPDEYNESIRRRTLESICRYESASPEEIDRRLSELDREWDIERAIEANAATVILLATTLGFAKRGFWVIPPLVAGFLLQHAVQGWCPPVPLLRRLGFRTQFEIEQERYALKALRGDFQSVSSVPGVGRRFEGVMHAIGR